MASKDWTRLPDDFVEPRTPAELKGRWEAAWQEAFKAMVELASDGEKGNVQAVLTKSIPYEAPRGWARSINEQFKQDLGSVRPTAERLAATAHQFHRAATMIREIAETDPNYFPSPVGQALLQVFENAMLHAVGSADLGHSVGQPMNVVVWPTLAVALRNTDILVLPEIATQCGTVPFETWANRFRRVVSDALEGWYRPLVSAFYRLSRVPVDGKVPAEVAQMGQLFKQAQEHWPPASPLLLLVDRRIAIVRNSEAHNHTELDLAAERFTFINTDRAGVETDRWSASPMEFQRLVVHFFHLGEVMRTLLMVIPVRSLDPDTMLNVLSLLLTPPTPPSAPSSAG